MDELVERVIGAIRASARPGGYTDYDTIARAIIPIVLRDAAEICEQECQDSVEGAAMAALIRARASEIEEQRG